MTKQEFIDFASKQVISTFTSSTKFTETEMDSIVRTYYKDPFDSIKMLDFLCDFDSFFLKRFEKVSGDLLTFHFGYIPSIHFKDPNPLGAFYWQDIKMVTVICITIENCAGTIEHIYISEDGRFYNDEHNLIAETQDELFDYIAFVEYDFHPVINERTYFLLKKSGWYQGRRVDIDNELEKLALQNIELTEAQKAFLREFGGLSFKFNDSNYNIQIWSIERIVKNDEILFEDENVITVGIKMSDTFGLDLNGILYESGYPLGRTMLESINHLLNKVPLHYEWIENEENVVNYSHKME